MASLDETVNAYVTISLGHSTKSPEPPSVRTGFNFECIVKNQMEILELKNITEIELSSNGLKS